MVTASALTLSVAPLVPVLGSSLAWAQEESATPTVSEQLWSNPEARSADPDSGVSAKITAQSAALANPEGVLKVTIRIENNSEQPVSGLELRVQRAAPVDTAAGVATSLLGNQGEYPWVGEFVQVNESIAAGESKDFEVTVPVGEVSTAESNSGQAASNVTLPGLGITTPGVHPLLFNLNGNAGDADTAFLAAARTTLTVTPAETASAATREASEASTATVPGLTVLWPLSSASVATAGQVGDAPDPAELYLPDESLADELSEGGRLRGLLDTWRNAVAEDAESGATKSSQSHRALRKSLCLAIDPDLVETVDRMTRGYRVGTAVPSPVESPTRLRDSWGNRDHQTDSTKGTGQKAASAWLDDLREMVSDACVIPLPFANADVNAIAAGSDPWLTEELSARGTDVIEDILGVTPAAGVHVPGSGYVEPDALATIAAADSSPVTAVVADSTLDTATETPSESGSESGEDPARNSVRSAVATLPGTSVRTLRYPAELGAALAATGVRPETAAYTGPSRRRDLAADGAASRMAGAVGVLDRELEESRSDTREVLAVPPAAWSVDATDAQTFLDAVASHFSDGSAIPVSLGDALSAPASSAELREDPAAIDPAPVDDGEARNVAQIAGHLRNLTDIMDDVPNIALTKRIYTRPMFDDLLRSLSDTGRRVRAESAEVRRHNAGRTGQITGLAYDLRNAVSLLPPGNVYTRTSDSSPLIIVARNGLPLPVTVRVNYASAPGVTLNTPGVQQIPARGSVTLQMTSSIPDAAEQSDLTMYLSTPNDLRISDEVTVRVASVPGVGSGTVTVVVAALVLIFGLGWFIRRRRRHSDGSPSGGRVLNDGGRD